MKNTKQDLKLKSAYMSGTMRDRHRGTVQRQAFLHVKQSLSSTGVRVLCGRMVAMELVTLQVYNLQCKSFSLTKIEFCCDSNKPRAVPI